MQDTICKRFKAAREEAGMTQQQLSDALGFKDRQTIAAIEAGIRKLSAEELLRAMQTLKKDAAYFTDPFRLEGEGEFTWLTDGNSHGEIEALQEKASGWLAIYRVLAYDNADKKPRRIPFGLTLTSKSSVEDAQHAGEWLAAEWQLGDLPAQNLEARIRERLRALILNIDAPRGIHAAACRLPEFTAILVGRDQDAYQRHFDLAFQLFHLLTWETAPPAHTERAGSGANGKLEQLANAFALALLIPESRVRDAFSAMVVEKNTEWPQENSAQGMKTLTPQWLVDRASELEVGAVAYQWRLVQLGLLTRDRVDEDVREADRRLLLFDATAYYSRALMAEPASRANRRPVEPRVFSEEFVRVLHAGLESGRISAARAASLLGKSAQEIADLFHDYQLTIPNEPPS